MGNIDETTKFIRRSLSFPARVNDPPNTGSLVLPNTVIVFPYAGSRLSLADHPPSTLPTRNAVALGEPVDPSLSDPQTIAMAFLVIRGHATAHHLGRAGGYGWRYHGIIEFTRTRRRTDVQFVGPSMRFLICRSKAPRRCRLFVRLALLGDFTSSVKPQVDLPFLGDTIAIRAKDMYSEKSLSVPVRPKNPLEAWGAF